MAAQDSPQLKVERRLFKDYFDQTAAERMAHQVGSAWKEFDIPRFVELATTDLGRLEFHGRIHQFSKALKACLPESTPRALSILTESLPPALPNAEAITDGWLQWPVGHFIADNGLPHFEEAMEAMIELTQRFSAEFAVRPFLESYPTKTLTRLLGLTAHPSVHVRRWCSEGCRPRLPWGKTLQSFIQDPTPLWPILEALKADPERYVQRSVANHLNDIAKDHPDLLLKKFRAWTKDGLSKDSFVIQHGLRSLVKAGHSEILHFLGFGDCPNVAGELSLTPKTVSVGDSVQLILVLRNEGKSSATLLIDYGVSYVRQRGRSGTKVFKWTKRTLRAGEVIEIRKMHSMRATTVRALYEGEHKVAAQINGRILAETSFRLRTAR
ncbi:MAG: DNA alkylation repair protein [Verrucomicrobiales bacterium]